MNEAAKSNLTGRTILLTSGPTFAPLDDVRSITNHSTGRLGSAIASALLEAGSTVWMLAGETSQKPDASLPNLHIESFRTVPELKSLLQTILQRETIDAVIMAAAVLDYLPAEIAPNKKSSGDETWTITLKRGEKLIERIRQWSPSSLLVGFKLVSNVSVEELQTKAEDLMHRSGASLVVGNRMQDIDRHTHTAYLFERCFNSATITVSPPLLTREQIAETLTQRLSSFLQEQD